MTYEFILPIHRYASKKLDEEDGFDVSEEIYTEVDLSEADEYTIVEI